MRWAKLLVGESLFLEKRHEMQQVEAVSRERVGRTPSGAQVPHEARDDGNGGIVFIEEDVRNVLFIVELNTLDSHGSLAPSVETGHLFFTRTDALQGAKCLLNSTRPGVPVEEFVL